MLFSDAFNDHTQRKFSSNLSLLWKRRAELCVLFYSALIRFYWILNSSSYYFIVVIIIPLFFCVFAFRTLIYYILLFDTTELLLCDAIIRFKRNFVFMYKYIYFLFLFHLPNHPHWVYMNIQTMKWNKRKKINSLLLLLTLKIALKMSSKK